MNARPETSIVRFFTEQGTVIGTGFLIAERTLITCAHVVTAALLLKDSSEMPTEAVSLDFPLITTESKFSAQVVFWQPPQDNDGGDIAVLQLNSEPPARAKMALLVVTDDLWGHDFRAFGFPTHYDNGVWASGKLRASEATGWILIEDVKETGYSVQRGFSGGPVWDEQLDGIVGMVVAADDDPARKAAYIIPSKTLIAAYPKLGDRLVRRSDLPEYNALEGDNWQTVIEQLRSRGLIYELFSYMKMARVIPSNLFDKMLTKVYTQGSKIKFINREEALSLAEESYGPPYLLFDAPAGYGKTQLLWEIEQRYLLKGWICYYIETVQTVTTARDLVQTLASSANLFRRLPGLDDLRFSGEVIAEMLKTRVELAGAQGIALLIDSIERLPDEERNSFRNHFLRSLIEAFTDNTFEKQRPSLRIMLAGRYLSVDWKKTDWAFPLEVKSLKPFNYDIVLTAIRNSNEEYLGDLKTWAAHLVHMTGGHPGCIAEMLPLIESIQSVEEHFVNHREAYRNVVLAIINKVRSSIPKHLQDIFDRLSVFRRYNVRLLRSMIETGVIPYDNGAVKLEQELTSNFLVNRRNKFIQDEIVRRLLAIRLRWTNPDLFLWLCERARNIYKSDLDGMNTDTENILVEAIYQELQLAYYQSNQDVEAREHLRQAFLGENGVVQQYIGVLAAKPSLDHDDIKLNLKEMLADKSSDWDWEFHFTVNFFLRSDHYTDEPFETMMHYIDQF